MLRLSAAWVLPIAAPPIEDGAVLVNDSGRIVVVGADSEVPAPPDADAHDLGRVALLPGLVNTHTHLELTGFAGQVEDPVFRDWILHLMRIKSARTDEEFFVAAQAGITRCWASGVTTFCDTGNSRQVIAAMHALGASGIAHHEVFGPHPEQRDTAIRAFARELDAMAHHATGRIALGISPHAPYTVSGPLYRAAADLARAHGAPIAVHVAEPHDEVALLANFTGTFADGWRARGIPRPTEIPISPINWLDQHAVLSPRTLCIHAIHADAADVALMKQRGVAIAHCPRSNRRHHHADAPVARYVEAGLRMGLGTDSEVSVAPLDLLAEARAAGELGGWNDAETLRALTLGGAEAIDVADSCGSLERGKFADITAIDVDGDDPVRGVLESALDDVVATWLGGRAVYQRDRLRA